MSEINAKIRFDPTISWGSIANFILIIGAAISVYVALQVRGSEHTIKIAQLEAMAAEYKATAADLRKDVQAIATDVAVIKAHLPAQRAAR